MFGAYVAAALLVVLAVRLHLTGVQGLLAELQYLRGVVVNGNDGVEQGLRLAPGELKGEE